MSDLERAVETIRAMVAGTSADIEAARRVPPGVAAACARGGLIRMLAPAGLGGGEVHPNTFARLLSRLASADAATAWCVMTGATTGLLTAWLRPDAAALIWADPEAVLAGVFAPMGRAAREGDHYRVSGRWPFMSGCENASWRLGGAIVDGKARSMFLRADQTEVLDTWHVAGLRGTGSHHVQATDALVPAALTADLTRDPPHHPGALYTFPPFGLLAVGVCAVGLGIARAAVEHFVEGAAVRGPNGRSAADDSLVQVTVARAEADLRAATAYLHTAIDEAWDAALATGATTVEHRAALRMAATRCTELAVSTVDALYTAGGGRALYETSPLQRHLRDIHGVTQHIMVSKSTYKAIGRVVLGADPGTALL